VNINQLSFVITLQSPDLTLVYKCSLISYLQAIVPMLELFYSVNQWRCLRDMSAL
jgi:hypothetical protein